MKKFAKLFEDEKYGQVLVINSVDDEDRPALLIKFSAEGLGVCEAAMSFPDDSAENYDKRDKAFEEITKEKAVNGISAVIDSLLNQTHIETGESMSLEYTDEEISELMKILKSVRKENYELKCQIGEAVEIMTSEQLKRFNEAIKQT